MTDIRKTQVEVEASMQHGSFANAFRVVKEVGPDFIIFTEDCQAARVVSRVRVRREFLPTIRKTLSDALMELEGVPPTKEGQPIH